MKREDIRICILRVGGTNCDYETQRSFRAMGVQAHTVHANNISKGEKLMEYDALVLPGGFAHGDYVRAGAIWAKWLISTLNDQLIAFVEDRRPILGICNGFQVLVEAGLLPSFKGKTIYPEAALTTNSPPGYNCRWIYIRHENRGNCIFTRNIEKDRVLRIPVAHAEGRFVFPRERERSDLDRLYRNDQLVFRYCHENGKHAEGEYPANPNGSYHDIGGICNPEGTILGLMPHPERAFLFWQQPDWTRQEHVGENGDGRLIFEGLASYLESER